jgi:hypothetical protein
MALEASPVYESGARNALVLREMSPGDQANTPLLAALASFSGVAAVFILYALIARYYVRPQNAGALGMVMADGTIWGVGGRRGKLEVPLGPPPCITEIWIPHSSNVLATVQTLWNAVQPVTAAPVYSISENANVDAFFYHPIAVSHLNPTLVVSSTLPPAPRGHPRQNSLSSKLTAVLDKFGLRLWRGHQSRELVSPSIHPVSNHAGTISTQSLDHDARDVDVSVLIRMPMPSVAIKCSDEMNSLDPLVIGVTRGRAPRASLVLQAQA